MTDEELLDKNFQLATLKLLINNNALLRTIIEAQISIIAKLEGADGAQVAKNMNEFIEENKALAYKMIQESIPEFRFGPRDHTQA
jgi:hypothetical protein